MNSMSAGDGLNPAAFYPEARLHSADGDVPSFRPEPALSEEPDEEWSSTVVDDEKFFVDLGAWEKAHDGLAVVQDLPSWRESFVDVEDYQIPGSARDTTLGVATYGPPSLGAAEDEAEL